MKILFTYRQILLNLITIVLAISINGDSFDWRDIRIPNPMGLPRGNYVTPVKDQGNPSYTGSCWAFAVIGAVESKYLIQNKLPGYDLDLSEQLLISFGYANMRYYDKKCWPGSMRGGHPENAFQFMKEVGTIYENNLRYSRCNLTDKYFELSRNKKEIFRIEGYKRLVGPKKAVPGIPEMKNYLKKYGPLVGGIHIAKNDRDNGYREGDWYWPGTTYRQYASDSDSSKSNRHLVLVVGYRDRVEDNLKEYGCGYWIVKNSYGIDKNWGPEGDGFGYIPYDVLINRGCIYAIDGSVLFEHLPTKRVKSTH